MDAHDRSLNNGLGLLVELIHQRTGLIFTDTRLELLEGKLAVVLKGINFDSLMDYYYFLKYDRNAESEWLRLQSALAVNETYFFREYEAIAATAEEIVPRLLLERPNQPVRIWHPACASGEEPYTLAIALEETGCFTKGQVVIDATDFNTAALDQARSGLYRQRSFRRIPKDILQRYFNPQPGGQYKLSPLISNRVNFGYLNLMDDISIAKRNNYDIIFCRNVFIYFSDAAIRQVVSWFHKALNTSGYLFVAAAESLLRVTHDFELVEVQNSFAYQKRFRPDELNKRIGS